VHGVGRDHPVDQVKRIEQGAQGGDLVALEGDLHLAQDDPGGVVQGRDQVRGSGPGGLGAAHRLAVDRDDVPAREQPDPGPNPRPDQLVEAVAVQGGERTTDRGFRGWSAPTRTEVCQGPLSSAQRRS